MHNGCVGNGCVGNATIVVEQTRDGSRMAYNGPPPFMPGHFMMMPGRPRQVAPPRRRLAPAPQQFKARAQANTLAVLDRNGNVKKVLGKIKLDSERDTCKVCRKVPRKGCYGCCSKACQLTQQCKTRR